MISCMARSVVPFRNSPGDACVTHKGGETQPESGEHHPPRSGDEKYKGIELIRYTKMRLPTAYSDVQWELSLTGLQSGIQFNSDEVTRAVWMKDSPVGSMCIPSDVTAV